MPPRILDSFRTPSLSISNTGNSTAGQKSTKAASAAAAVRLADRWRDPGVTIPAPHRVQIALVPAGSVGNSWISPQQ
jgi:hypothetical protein